jgi:hypothetical protein
MGFGRYCQIHKEDQPRNGMVQPTQGAILLGPSGNAQGGHKFFTLNTGKMVIYWAWTELPTSMVVIERVALLAKGTSETQFMSNVTIRFQQLLLQRPLQLCNHFCEM